MASFLLVYDRKAQKLVEPPRLVEDESSAMRLRFELELQYRERPDVEVAVLRAKTEEDLRRTHSRYFGPPIAGLLAS